MHISFAVFLYRDNTRTVTDRCIVYSNSMSTQYNGWTNKATWLVKLWLDNDEYTYNEVNELLKDVDGYEAEQVLINYVDDLVINDSYIASLALDLVNYALSDVNWSEIVKAVKDN